MDRDNDTVLSLKELTDGIKTLGLEMTDDEVQEVFTELDTDGSKTLDLQEFFVAVRVGSLPCCAVCISVRGLAS